MKHKNNLLELKEITNVTGVFRYILTAYVEVCRKTILSEQENVNELASQLSWILYSEIFAFCLRILCVIYLTDER